MATKFEKVTEFITVAAQLLSTSKRMEDIFHSTMKRNEKKIAVEYINHKGKIKHDRYSKLRSPHRTVRLFIYIFFYPESKARTVSFKW